MKGRGELDGMEGDKGGVKEGCREKMKGQWQLSCGGGGLEKVSRDKVRGNQ